MLVMGCGGSELTNSSTVTTILPTGDNVMQITVNGSLCSEATAYLNKPCVSVTICSPGTSDCRTINDILLDTGSTGLRIFQSVLGGLSFTQVMANSREVAECITFGDGSSLWGPVQIADVKLGGEPAVQIPVQVINASYQPNRSVCTSADATPAAAGYNGILGLGLFAEDCGTYCTLRSGNGMYYGCTSTGCSGTALPVDSQVQNPVAHLPVDNNGVMVSLPAVAQGGVASATGALVLGIGTRSNNIPGTVTTYPADASGYLTTVFSGQVLSDSFLDTGSNGLFFPSTTLSDCSGSYSGWYCPNTVQTLTAYNNGTSLAFMIGNFVSLYAANRAVYVEIGGTYPGGFDWGLPFFFGRTVYVGIDGTTTPLGTGPYWAY